MEIVFLDACSWLNIPISDNFNPQLELLQRLVVEGHIKLVCHIQVAEEWNKNKEKKIAQLKSTVESKLHGANKFFEELNLVSLTITSGRENGIQEQIERVENLLSQAIVLETSDEVKVIIADAAFHRRAPFHRGNSGPDAFIYYSFIEWAKTSAYQAVTFISDNPADFCDTRDKEKNNLHPDLIVAAGDVSVTYYNNVHYAIRELAKKYNLKPPIMHDYARQDKYEMLTIAQRAELEKKHIITQLSFALDRYFKEWQFIPPRQLAKRFPFSLNSSGFLKYENHILYTNNEGLYKFLKQIKIDKGTLEIPLELLENGNVAELQKQLEDVLECMTGNLVYKVSTFSAGEVDIAFIKERKACDCVRCLFNNFEFENLAEKIKETSAKKDRPTLEDLRLGYVQYKLGNFIAAYEVYQLVISKCRKQNNHGVHYYIALYNLSKLAPYFTHLQNMGQPVSEQLNTCNKIDLTKETVQLITQENEDAGLIADLLATDFFYESYLRIDGNLTKIRDHYQSQLYGGVSNNDYISQLVNDYNEMSLYVTNNFILYEYFSEFESFTNKFIEGVFLSYQIDKSYGGSGLVALNDYLLVQMLLHGEKDYILKQFNKSTISKFNYSESSGRFPYLLEQIIQDYIRDTAYQKHLLESGNTIFKDKRCDMMHKALLLAGMVNLKNDFINSLARQLSEGLQSGRFKHYDQKYLTFFLAKNANQIDKAIIEEILANATAIVKGNAEDFIAALCDLISKTYPGYRINNTTIFDMIMASVSKRGVNRLVFAYPLLSQRGKSVFRKHILDVLRTGYDDELYYLSAIYGAIPVASYFELFKQNCLAAIGDEKVYSPWNLSPVTHRKVNMLLNLALKANIKLAHHETENIKSISQYYNWLVDPENFDYNTFDPQWIGLYSTIYFIKRLKKISHIQKAIKAYLLDHKNEKIKKIFLTHYV